MRWTVNPEDIGPKPENVQLQSSNTNGDANNSADKS